MRQPNKLGWVGWPEKLSSPAGGRSSTWEPAPQRPPGETSEPAKDTQKATDLQGGYQNWRGTAATTSRRDPESKVFCKWLYLELKRDSMQHCIASLSQGCPGGLRTFPVWVTQADSGRCAASFVVASLHKQGKPSGNGRPDLAAQDRSDSILRATLPNVVGAQPTHTCNMLHAVPCNQPRSNSQPAAEEEGASERHREVGGQ